MDRKEGRRAGGQRLFIEGGSGLCPSGTIPCAESLPTLISNIFSPFIFTSVFSIQSFFVLRLNKTGIFYGKTCVFFSSCCHLCWLNVHFMSLLTRVVMTPPSKMCTMTLEANKAATEFLQSSAGELRSPQVGGAAVCLLQCQKKTGLVTFEV